MRRVRNQLRASRVHLKLSARLSHRRLACHMAFMALVRAADAWRTVLAFNDPPDWLRASGAVAYLLGAHRAALQDLLGMEPVCDVPASLLDLIDEGWTARLWYLLRKNPELANDPLDCIRLTYPLHAAVDHRSPSSLRTSALLLQVRARVDNVDDGGETALHLAAVFAELPIVRLLIQKMANVNAKSALDATPLHLAAQCSDVRVASLLLEARASGLDAQRTYEDPNHNGATPLLLASEKNKLLSVEALLRAGARGVNICKANGVSALIAAAKRGYVDLIQRLLSVNKEDPGVPTSATPWTSPLTAACDAGHLEVVRLLIHAAASLEVPCPGDGEVPLITAVRAGHASIVTLLLGSGAKSFGAYVEHPFFTPLYLASSAGSADIVELLLFWRAIPTKRLGRTPLYTAARHGHEEVVRALLAAGLQDDDALVAAETAGHLRVLSLLRASQLCVADG